MKHISRRTLLRALPLVAWGSLVTRTLSGSNAGNPPVGLPPEVGRKFYSDGRPYPFAGNTIICHLPKSSAIFHAATKLHSELAAASYSKKLGLLPTDSYHMTVMNGADDRERQPGLWPADIPFNASMEECNRHLLDKLRAFKLDCRMPFRLRVDAEEAAQAKNPCTVRLIPLDEEEEKKLRHLRDRLSQVLQIRAPDHDRYRFHITIAYLVNWLTAGEQQDFEQLRRMWLTAINRQNVIIELGPPEFCIFQDMFRFDVQLTLGQRRANATS